MLRTYMYASEQRQIKNFIPLRNFEAWISEKYDFWEGYLLNSVTDAWP